MPLARVFLESKPLMLGNRDYTSYMRHGIAKMLKHVWTQFRNVHFEQMAIP